MRRAAASILDFLRGLMAGMFRETPIEAPLYLDADWEHVNTTPGQ